MESNYRRIVARSIVEFVGMKRVWIECWNYMCGRARYKITRKFGNNFANGIILYCKQRSIHYELMLQTRE